MPQYSDLHLLKAVSSWKKRKPLHENSSSVCPSCDFCDYPVSQKLSLLQQRVHFLLHPSCQLGVCVQGTAKNEWNFIPAPYLCHEHCTNKMEHPHTPLLTCVFPWALVIPLLLNLLFIIKSYLEIKIVGTSSGTHFLLKIYEEKGILSAGALKYSPWWQF